MNKSRSLLTYYTFNPEVKSIVAEYSVEQNNGKTSVNQRMTLSCDNIDALSSQFNGQEWNATIELDDFPSQTTPQAAADKLADWLERLASGIRSGDYTLPDHNTQFKDLDGDGNVSDNDDSSVN